MVAKLKDVPLEFGEFVILKELQEKEETALKKAEEEPEADSAEANPATSLHLVPIPVVNESHIDSLEVGSTADGLSPRRLDD
eukprot:5311248-Amphidinium_carterae.1